MDLKPVGLKSYRDMDVEHDEDARYVKPQTDDVKFMELVPETCRNADSQELDAYLRGERAPYSEFISTVYCMLDIVYGLLCIADRSQKKNNHKMCTGHRLQDSCLTIKINLL